VSRRLAGWWGRQGLLQQWGWVTAGCVLVFMLLTTAGWAVLQAVGR
jgi:hypothetical protein